MSQIRTILLCAAVGLCAFAGNSAGQPDKSDKPKVSKANVDKAKNHYHRAQSYKQLGEYRKAAEEFLEAYELYQDAEFYFNAGEMYRLAGDKDLAVEYFQKYLMAHPDGRVSQAARTSVEELTSELEASRAREEAAKAAAREPHEPGKTGAPEASADGDHAPPDTEVARAGEADAGRHDEAARAPSSGGSFKVAGIASGAVGLLSFALGVKYGLDASSASDELSVKYDPQTEKDGEAAEKKMFIFYGVGAAALIAGGVLYYVGHGRSARAERARSLSLTPRLDGDGVTLWVQGRF